MTHQNLLGWIMFCFAQHTAREKTPARTHIPASHHYKNIFTDKLLIDIQTSKLHTLLSFSLHCAIKLDNTNLFNFFM